MTKMLMITFMILFTTALAFSPGSGQSEPGCIVQPDVIEACESGGGRFDYKICSCVGAN
jgi:hypothetical protein